jgi:hypothetical protein
MPTSSQTGSVLIDSKRCARLALAQGISYACLCKHFLAVDLDWKETPTYIHETIPTICPRDFCVPWRNTILLPVIKVWRISITQTGRIQAQQAVVNKVPRHSLISGSGIIICWTEDPLNKVTVRNLAIE